ncbi:MAG TPA: nitrous oxide-stimulated promoter family protein [Dehalococcoidia bacterium]|nr:nitrous oxide-stimulated promoter family protein [Dehalococcoidia bacterium]
MSVKSSRIAREGRTVQVMISLYCRHHHHDRKLCNECVELTNYALERLRKCPFGEGKTVCAKCPVHCYQPLMREKIRAVMRYAGPRMTLRHPFLTLFHFIDKMRKEPVKPVKRAIEK